MDKCLGTQMRRCGGEVELIGYWTNQDGIRVLDTYKCKKCGMIWNEGEGQKFKFEHTGEITIL